MRKQDWIVGFTASLLFWGSRFVPALLHGLVWFRAPYTVEWLNMPGGDIVTRYTLLSLLVEILVLGTFFTIIYSIGHWIVIRFIKDWISPSEK
jgi:hypothetical protein